MSSRCSFKSSAVMSRIRVDSPRKYEIRIESACQISPPGRSGARGVSTLLGAVLCLGSTVLAVQAAVSAPPAAPESGSAVAQERRDVDLVVADLEGRALHARAAVAAAGPVAGLLASRTRPRAAVVEPGGDHRHPDLVAHVLVDYRAEDDV